MVSSWKDNNTPPPQKTTVFFENLFNKINDFPAISSEMWLNDNQNRCCEQLTIIFTWNILSNNLFHGQLKVYTPHMSNTNICRVRSYFSFVKIMKTYGNFKKIIIYLLISKNGHYVLCGVVRKRMFDPYYRWGTPLRFWKYDPWLIKIGVILL